MLNQGYTQKRKENSKNLELKRNKIQMGNKNQ